MIELLGLSMTSAGGIRDPWLLIALACTQLSSRADLGVQVVEPRKAVGHGIWVMSQPR